MTTPVSVGSSGVARNAANRFPSWASSTRSSCDTAAPRRIGIGGEESGSQHIVEKSRRPFERLDAVLELPDRVALVLVHEQLAPDSLARQHGMDLLRLLERHAGIVRAVLDEERRAHPVDVRDRRCLDEELP